MFNKAGLGWNLVKKNTSLVCRWFLVLGDASRLPKVFVGLRWRRGRRELWGARPGCPTLGRGSSVFSAWAPLGAVVKPLVS